MTTAPEKNAPAREPGAWNGVLAEPEWLEAHLDDPTVRVVEVDVSQLAYDAGAHRRGRAVGHLRRPQGRRLPARRRPRPWSGSWPGRASARTRRSCSTGTRRHGLLADEALRPRRRPDPRLLPRGVAGRRPPWSARRPSAGRHELPPARAGRPPARRPHGGGERDRRPGHHYRGRALGGRVPGRAVLALRRHGARRPSRSRPDRGPPAHRRPLRRARVVPSVRPTSAASSPPSTSTATRS